MTLNNIEQARQRVLNIVCPFCNAAATQLCIEKITNAAGIQSRHTNIFHAERIAKAQDLSEKALDFTKKIQQHLNEHPLK